MANDNYINQHAAVRTSPNVDASVGGYTRTVNREDNFDVSIETDSSNSSRLVIELESAVFSMTGRQARTLQRVLNKHFDACGSSRPYSFS